MVRRGRRFESVRGWDRAVALESTILGQAEKRDRLQTGSEDAPLVDPLVDPEDLRADGRELYPLGMQRISTSKT
jgi:hypothetical protein